MEYHSDRFTDYSLMVYEDQKLIAIMPANIDENGDVHSQTDYEVISHLLLVFLSTKHCLQAPCERFHYRFVIV